MKGVLSRTAVKRKAFRMVVATKRRHTRQEKKASTCLQNLSSRTKGDKP